MPMLTKLFGFNPKETTIRTEIFAGITTFLTMSYILAVNPAMFSVLDGMPAGAAFTATALAAVIGTLVMAFWACFASHGGTYNHGIPLCQERARCHAYRHHGDNTHWHPDGDH